MPGLKERLTLSPELPIPPLNSDFSFKSIRIPFLYTSDSWCVRVCAHVDVFISNISTASRFHVLKAEKHWR